MDEMKPFPIMLDLGGKLAVVVGAGPVGLRKVSSLLDCRARVRIVEPCLAKAAAKGLKAKGVEVVAREYGRACLAGATLVFACTDDRELNSRVAADARAMGALVNAADQTEDCDFTMPAAGGDGPVIMAIGTGGACPALAGWLRDRLQEAMPRKIGPFAKLLSRLRRELQAKVDSPSARGQAIRELVKRGGYDAFVAGGAKAVRELLARIVGRQ
jgi:siroheme synthase-like protein